ncbi:hypothetical protein Bbelb_387280 [Branchiostoma belcheri]|nr:hypothetical protein Bbelb_387280 [Branchiostoma belcheri]
MGEGKNQHVRTVPTCSTKLTLQQLCRLHRKNGNPALTCWWGREAILKHRQEILEIRERDGGRHESQPLTDALCLASNSAGFKCPSRGVRVQPPEIPASAVGGPGHVLGETGEPPRHSLILQEQHRP